jgi:hypothetical protein
MRAGSSCGRRRRRRRARCSGRCWSARTARGGRSSSRSRYVRCMLYTRCTDVHCMCTACCMCMCMCMCTACALRLHSVCTAYSSRGRRCSGCLTLTLTLTLALTHTQTQTLALALALALAPALALTRCCSGCLPRRPWSRTPRSRRCSTTRAAPSWRSLHTRSPVWGRRRCVTVLAALPHEHLEALPRATLDKAAPCDPKQCCPMRPYSAS